MKFILRNPKCAKYKTMFSSRNLNNFKIIRFRRYSVRVKKDTNIDDFFFFFFISILRNISNLGFLEITYIINI